MLVLSKAFNRTDYYSAWNTVSPQEILFFSILLFFLLVSKQVETGRLGPDCGQLCGLTWVSNRARKVTSFLTTDLLGKSPASGKAGGRPLAELWLETLRAWNRQCELKSQKRENWWKELDVGERSKKTPTFKFYYLKLYIFNWCILSY